MDLAIHSIKLPNNASTHCLYDYPSLKRNINTPALINYVSISHALNDNSAITNFGMLSEDIYNENLPSLYDITIPNMPAMNNDVHYVSFLFDNIPHELMSIALNIKIKGFIDDLYVGGFSFFTLEDMAGTESGEFPESIYMPSPNAVKSASKGIVTSDGPLGYTIKQYIVDDIDYEVVVPNNVAGLSLWHRSDAPNNDNKVTFSFDFNVPT